MSKEADQNCKIIIQLTLFEYQNCIPELKMKYVWYKPGSIFILPYLKLSPMRKENHLSNFCGVTPISQGLLQISHIKIYDKL